MSQESKTFNLEESLAKLVDIAGKPIEVPEGDIREALPLLPINGTAEQLPPTAHAPEPVNMAAPNCRQTMLTVRLTHDNMTELLADVCATRYPWIGRILAEWLPDTETGAPLAVAEVSLLLPVGMPFEDQERAFITALGTEGRKNRDLRETVKQLQALVDRYDTEATETRNVLGKAGVPEFDESAVDEHGHITATQLSLSDRVSRLAQRCQTA